MHVDKKSVRAKKKLWILRGKKIEDDFVKQENILIWSDPFGALIASMNTKILHALVLINYK